MGDNDMEVTGNGVHEAVLRLVSNGDSGSVHCEVRMTPVPEGEEDLPPCHVMMEQVVVPILLRVMNAAVEEGTTAVGSDTIN